MKLRTTRKFWRLFDALPGDVQVSARRAYAQFSTGPNHPSLNFKRVDRNDPDFSVRIGIHYRALGLLDGDTVTWFWICIHDDYVRVLNG